MSGKFNGVAARFQEEEPRALYTHCHAHLLDLAVMRFCEEVRQLRNCLSIVNALYNVINASAKRFAIFESICLQNGDKKYRRLVSLSRTRWTVRHKAINAILEQLPEIVDTLEVIASDASNGKQAAEADGLMKQVRTFEFVFNLKFLYGVLNQTDILSKELQSSTIDISLVFSKVEATIDCLKLDRNEDAFMTMWNETEELCKDYAQRDLCVERSLPPRKRKIPRKLETSDPHTDSSYQHKTLEETFKVDIFFAGLDTIIQNLHARFSKNDYDKICGIAQLLFQWDGIDNAILQEIQTFYGFSSNLSTQLKFFHSYVNKNFTDSPKTSSITSLQEVADFFVKHNLQNNVPLVMELLEIALAWPITTATAERSFSSLRRLKTYLRSTMKEDRLNGLALMAINQDLTLKLMKEESLNALVQRFSSRKERRLKLN